MKKAVYILFLLLLILQKPTEIAYAESTDNIFQQNAYRIVRKIDLEGKICLSYIFPLNSEIVKSNFTEKEYENYKLYLALYVNSLAKNNKQKAFDGVTVSGCAYYDDIDGIGFSVLFNSIDIQQKFFGVKPEEKQNIQK